MLKYSDLTLLLVQWYLLADTDDTDKVVDSGVIILRPKALEEGGRKCIPWRRLDMLMPATSFQPLLLFKVESDDGYFGSRHLPKF